MMTKLAGRPGLRVKVLITGGAGFIGSHLAESMCGQHDVVVLSRSGDTGNISGILPRVSLERCDVTDPAKLGGIIERHRPDAIVHLAGETSHARSFEDPAHDLDVNAKSTLHMLEKIRETGLGCRFVLGSTFIVIGRPGSLPVTEESPCNPTTIYGAHRLAAESYCRIYHNVYGLDTAVFRITNSFGPRERTDPKKNAVNFLIHEAFLGNDVTIFDGGDYFRDLVYVADVVSGIRAVVERGAPGELYWISSFEKTWFRDLGRILHDLTGAAVKYVEPPAYTKKVDVGNFLVDNSKLAALGWGKRYGLEEGIRETLAHFESRDPP